MENVTARALKSVLKTSLGEDAIIDVAKESAEQRVTGWIMHPTFRGVSQMARQEWLWNGFSKEANLSKWAGLREIFGEESTQIGLILLFSPEEYKNAFEESA